MTQAELANALELPRVSITRYENGTREPDYSTLKKIADYFGVTTEYLLAGEQPADLDFPRYYFFTEGYGMYTFNTEEERDKARNALNEAIRAMSCKPREEVLKYAQSLLEKDTPDGSKGAPNGEEE